jgi:hypothetical protein
MKKTRTPSVVMVLAITVAVSGGCGKKTDAEAELANTITVLEQPSPAPQPAATASPDTPASPQPAQQVNQALASLKAGNYSDTIRHLELARANPNKTPAQMMAIQDAMASVMTDLYGRAARGDVAAQQAIKQHQEERNRR